jgi:hypothetical protein
MNALLEGSLKIVVAFDEFVAWLSPVPWSLCFTTGQSG